MRDIHAGANDCRSGTRGLQQSCHVPSRRREQLDTITLDQLDFLADSGLLVTITRTDYTVTDNDAPGSLTEQNDSAVCSGGSSPTTGCITGTIGANGFTFTFDNPINAFGLLVSKSVLNTNFTELTLNGTSITGIFTPNPSTSTFGLIGFFGLMDTAPFTSVTLAGISGGNQLGLDDVRYGAASTQAVPEPASLILLGIGLAGLGAMRRRKKG